MLFSEPALAMPRLPIALLGGGNLAASQNAIQAAATLHKAGKTTAAINSLKDYLKTASAEESVRPMLRLGYYYVAAGRKGAAKERFNRLAQLPEGMDDAARGEAALRMAYLTHDRERALWAERIVAGSYKVTDDQLSSAYRLAAAEAHRRDDLRRAIELYQTTPELQTTGSRRAYIFKELAGLYFEVGKGEGDIPVAESVRPDMFTQARSICEELAEMKGAPSEDRMVGALMEAETWFFQGDYQTSYEHTKAFLAKYGDSPSKYKSNHTKRKYIVTAKTLQMQNCYFIGRHDEAQRHRRTHGEIPAEAEKHVQKLRQHTDRIGSDETMRRRTR